MKAFPIKHQNKLATVILFIINLLWFLKFKFHTLMGDDLYTWNVVHNYKEGFLQYTLFETLFGKYRPIYNLIQYFVITTFDMEYRLYFFLNILVNFVAVLIMYRLLLMLTKNAIISFLFSVIFITCRFSYYNILQVYGLMEAVALILFLLMLFISILFYKNSSKINIFLILLIETLMVFTHERYIVVVPFLLILFFLTLSKPKRIYTVIPLVPVILNFAIKKIVVNTSFLEGTGGASISFDIAKISIFLICGLLNMVGINVGAPYLNGINFTQESTITQILSVIILLINLLLLVFLIKQSKGSLENKKKLIVVGIALILILSLLLAASITIRQEYRWLFAPYAVFLLVTAFVFQQLKIVQSIKYVLIVLLCVIVFRNDMYYKLYLDRVYFIDALKIADSTYDATIKKYGSNIKNSKIYIEKDPSLVWTLQNDLFFKVNADEPNLKTNFVDNLSEIDLSQESLLLLKFNNLTRQMEDVTNEFVLDPKDRGPQIILPEEWATPDKGYTKTTVYGQTLYYKVVRKVYKNNSISMLRLDNDTVLSLSQNVVDNASLGNLEPNKFAYYSIDSETGFLWISVPTDSKINWKAEIQRGN
ncbi:hypothetical protein [Paenibacillus alba]|uniref:Glycosyltransferase RgtA/B/C/D-like domain-containing protein n=1 Tax=Paenibacillus alba TaxID=1197127 RepID=A0ABU6G2X9_9BACL|nr:hypothetical protein [Paenibacillus alba]MEC0227950.1 hypothetical protein [Paenibacillus alba]